jgi:hypothetical protein
VFSGGELETINDRAPKSTRRGVVADLHLQGSRSDIDKRAQQRSRHGTWMSLFLLKYCAASWVKKTFSDKNSFVLRTCVHYSQSQPLPMNNNNKRTNASCITVPIISAIAKHQEPDLATQTVFSVHHHANC